MPAAPLYGIGEIVYLRESAGIGFLEAYAVQSMRYSPGGTIFYTMVTTLRTPDGVQSIADRVTGQRILPLELREVDLIPYCEALVLCEANLELQLASIQRLRVGQGCPTVTG